MGRTPPGETRQRILAFMTERLFAGEPPTVREVRDAFGFRAVQTAREHLEALVERGCLTKEPGRARGYRLERPGQTAVMPVPIVGRVQAGRPSLAVEDIDGYVPVQTSSLSGSFFALRVRGESMRDAGILPDDLVVVRKQSTAANGDVVVALVGSDGEPEATVKRFKRIGQSSGSGARIELHSANPAFSPIVIDGKGASVTILGKVIEVRRSYS